MSTISLQTRLHENLSKLFSEDELRSLCLDMEVDYENLPGQAKAGKARELVRYLERRSRTRELIERCQALRPGQGFDFLGELLEIEDPRLRALREIIEDASLENEQFKRVFSGLRNEFRGLPPMALTPLWPVVKKFWDLYTPGGALQPIQVFVEYLADHFETCCHKPDLAAALRGWNEHHTASFGSSIEDLCCRRQRIQAGEDCPMIGDSLVLMVVLEPDPTNTIQVRRFKFRIYSGIVPHAGEWKGSEPPVIGDHFVGLEEIVAPLMKAVEDLLNRADASVRPRFEFFLPLDYLSEAVDQLQYEIFPGVPIRLGSEFEVVVRSTDRAQSRNILFAWPERWGKRGNPAVSRVFRIAGRCPAEYSARVAGDAGCGVYWAAV